ncbi:50S ribosomal protein L10 [Candidatus Micrarchaeota archaeon]|nr:50S ribosomal protein L10 [Candidatus Micrarchaeota archaeon]
MLDKQRKQEVVKEIGEDIQKYPTVALASIQNLPARQYGAIKKKTRSKAKIEFARATLLKKALDQRKELEPIAKELSSGSILVLSDLDAFSLFKLFKQNRSKAFAKPGVVAPSDLVVPAGDTSLMPGPVLTELKQAGIQAKIQGPKVVITKDAVVTKKGEVVSDSAAKILSKLGIEPMEVGVAVKKVYDHGTWYSADVLDIDEQAVLQGLVQAHQEALNLCVFAGVYNDVSVQLILQKAEREAMALQKAVGSSALPAAEEKKEEP